MCNERHFFFIFLLHWDLVVPLSGVNEAIKPMTTCGVYQLINYRQRIIVFRASFIDAAQGYHQIPMKKEDEEKTSFITHEGLYYYRVMPFKLKNAGAIYQRLMNHVL